MRQEELRIPVLLSDAEIAKVRDSSWVDARVAPWQKNAKLCVFQLRKLNRKRLATEVGAAKRAIATRSLIAGRVRCLDMHMRVAEWQLGVRRFPETLAELLAATMKDSQVNIVNQKERSFCVQEWRYVIRRLFLMTFFFIWPWPQSEI